MKAILVGDEVLFRLYRYFFRLSFLFITVFAILISGQVFAEVSDGANGGNQHFFFLPPLVSSPSPTGSFSATESPVVQICEWTGTDCVLPPIAEFTTTTGPAPERVKVATEDELYIVNLNTKRYELDPMKIYRIRVLFRTQEGVPIEKELGHADVTVMIGGNLVNNGESILIPKNMTLPITFRIEEGFFPIGELTPTDRAKISPVLLEQFISEDVIEPVEALVNVVDDQIPLPELLGVEILTDYRPTLAKVFVRISDPSTLASLVQDNNTEYVHENARYYLTALPWQEAIGQDHVELSGYLGTGAAVVILDDGGRDLDSDELPNHGIIDLSDPAFGGCTGVGTPASCRVVAEMNPSWADPCLQTHATHVARRVALTAPGVDIIAWDVGFQCDIDDRAYLWDNDIAFAYRWVLDHQHDYNIVAVNMSFASDESYSTEDCFTYNDESNRRLHEAGIMLIAASGNEGQTNGVSSPACQKFVMSVGGSDGSEIWSSSTRGPNLDLLAPAEDYDYGKAGTSISAPTVAGACAILRAAKPDLTVDETLEVLKTTGVPIYDPLSELTFYRIQLDAALLALGLPIVVYDNGASTHSGGTAVGHFIAADDFVLAVATDVSGASVDVSDGPADQNRRWDGTVEWWLFEDDAGVPGNLIAFGTGVNVEQHNIVVDSLGFRDFTVDFDFGEKIALPAGETFWLALHMQADYSRLSVFWDHQGSTVGHPARSGGELIGGVPNFVDGSYAGPAPFDKAFRVWAK